MGASISFDTKYRLILETEVDCISAEPPSSVQKDKRRGGSGSEHDGSDSGSGSGSGSGSEGEGEGGSGSDSGSDSDHDTKKFTVKITPEIVGYIRNYIRKNEFLDEFDMATEIELEKYDHAPGSAIVFNSDSVVYITNNNTIEAVGEWEYIAPEKVTKKSKSKSRDRHRDRGDEEEDTSNSNTPQYKTKEDELPIGEIETLLNERFEEYSKSHEFIIHQSKNTLLSLNIKSVEIHKA